MFETDGTNPVGVHEWTDARLLAPVGQPASFRLFSSLPDFDFRYLNPGIVVGPHASVLPAEGSALACLPCLAVVVAGGGSVVPVSEADGLVLGISIANVFYLHEAGEAAVARLPATSLDVGAAVGPALTTPDELDDAVEDEANGRRYALDLVLSIDGQEVWQANTRDLGVTIAEIFGQASLTTRLRQGDLFAVALPSPLPPFDLKSGSQVRLASERLGALVTKVT